MPGALLPLVVQLGQYKDCLEELQTALQYSEQLQDHSHDADILGEIADAHADLGNFEQAAKVYTCFATDGLQYIFWHLLQEYSEMNLSYHYVLVALTCGKNQ